MKINIHNIWFIGNILLYGNAFYELVTDRGSGNEKGLSSDGKKSSDQGSKLDTGNIKTKKHGYFPTIILLSCAFKMYYYCNAHPYSTVHLKFNNRKWTTWCQLRQHRKLCVSRRFW